MDSPHIKSPHLKRIAEIRNQIEALKAEAEALEPEAILERFEILESQKFHKQIVDKDHNAKILIQFRNMYDDKILSISRLDQDIAREYDNLCLSNATAIKISKAIINELQGKLE